MIKLISDYFRYKFIKAVTQVDLKKPLECTKKVLKSTNTNIKNNIEKAKYTFPLSFFYGDGQFQPIYYFIFVFCHLSIIMILLKLYGVWLKIKNGSFVSEDISTGDIATILSFVGGILTLYNFNRKKEIRF